jgi:hypothetical protein
MSADRVISNEYLADCILSNLPSAPTRRQSALTGDLMQIWSYPAAVVPFIILVLIGGWGGTFQSGDASAYIVGAIVVCVTESIFQQRENDFAILRKRWDRHMVFTILACVTILTWNMYFAVHDRHTGKPSVDWIQILFFFLSLFFLPRFRFVATQYDSPKEWTDYLHERIYRLHSRANTLLQEAVNHQPSDTAFKIHDKLVDAQTWYKYN